MMRIWNKYNWEQKKLTPSILILFPSIPKSIHKSAQEMLRVTFIAVPPSEDNQEMELIINGGWYLQL